MPSRTSLRRPVIAGARPRQLSQMLRDWRRQPHRRSPLLFWTLLALAVVGDIALLLFAAQRLGGAQVPTPPPTERRFLVAYAGRWTLWQPLRHWIVRVNGRIELFETFCRRALRSITGDEQFEQRDPLAVVVSWMLDNGGKERSWEQYPFVRCEDVQLRALLYPDGNGPSRMSRPEQLHGRYVEPMVPQHSRDFHKLLHSAAVKRQAGQRLELSALEKQAVALGDRLALWQQIRRGAVDGADGPEMRTPMAALRQTYQSGNADLFAAAANDFLAAARDALPVEEAPNISRRLACEAWLNAYDPVKWAGYASLWAAGLLAAALMSGRHRPWLRRCFLWCGKLACLGCLGWSSAALVCRTTSDAGSVFGDSTNVLLWAALMTMGLGLVLSSRHGEPLLLLAGAAASALSLALASRQPSAFDARLLCGSEPAGNAVWTSLQAALLLSAYAILTLVWSLAALTLARLLARPPSSERLRGLAELSLGPIRLVVALVAASTLFDVAAMRGASGLSWNAQALAALVVLPGCLVFLHARRKGCLGPFGVMLAIVLGAALPALLALSHNWLWGAAAANLSLAAHAALRYCFGRQRIFECA